MKHLELDKLTSEQRTALLYYIRERIPCLRSELQLRSTGVFGKFSEGIRIVLNKRPTDALRCRCANRTDIRIGRNIHIEVKTGSGAVAYAEDRREPFTKADCVAENVFPRARFVVWAPFEIVRVEEIVKLDDAEAALALFERLLRNSWVFTREQFVDMLERIGKNGLQSSLKVSKNGGQLNIQTITPRMEDRLWDILDDQPTAWQVFIEK